jgi:TatD DNase family protein
MTFIDTHCHLTFDDFGEDLPEVLRRAQEAGVAAIVTIGLDLESSRAALELARKVEADAFGLGPERTRVHVGVGVHPHDSARWDDASAERLRELAADRHVVALGETGLDFFRDYAPREAQYRAFRGTLALARELDMPIILHVRAAMAEVLEVLAEFYPAGVTPAARPGVLHCFSGGPADVERAAAMGFCFGFGGPLTYKRPPFDAVRAASRESLLLETDAPFLAPVPYRGKRNESSFLSLSARGMAGALAATEEEVAAFTTANARRLFGLVG